MYVIYDYTLGKVVKESCNLEVLEKAAKRYKHLVAIKEKYGNGYTYKYYKNHEEVK